uniref:leukocyte elastase inhibitor-like n=1 Tax=Myxine glutinosa TaxID=7769 RepID=UPI00358DDF5C
MEKLVEANSSFALDMFSQLNKEQPTGNIFFSPLSVSAALAMLSLGSRTNTAEQMAKVLHFEGKSGDALHKSFLQLHDAVNSQHAKYALHMANRLYGDKGFTFLKEFLETTLTLYRAELEPVDFVKAPEDSRLKINGWVEEQTAGKITNILSKDVINSMTRMVLVNAIYFKGKWENTFKTEDTREADFFLNKNETKKVQMMMQEDEFMYGSIELEKSAPQMMMQQQQQQQQRVMLQPVALPENSVHILELPYIDNELSMLLLLPSSITDDSTGLKQLEKELNLEKLREWTHSSKMFKKKLEVFLPKFRLETLYGLRKPLSELGMPDAFSAKTADFSGITGNRDLFVSAVVHKAFVEVNEEGTEAAAATAVVMMLGCMPTPPQIVRFDHPFLFFIRHNSSGSILFWGRYTSP